jgi:lactoylglutathione lyase
MLRSRWATFRKRSPSDFLDFLDPWGNRVQVVEYRDLQFTKAPEVLRGMQFLHLDKSEKAKKELVAKRLG